MNKEHETSFKLQLAHDLIIFLVNLQTNGMEPERKLERTNVVLDAWGKSVDIKIREATSSNVKSIAKSKDIEEDVIKILTDIHQIEPAYIRKAFELEVKHTIFNSSGVET